MLILISSRCEHRCRYRARALVVRFDKMGKSLGRNKTIGCPQLLEKIGVFALYFVTEPLPV
jgi:hypothetical protein